MFKVVNKLELLLRTDKAGFRDADASKKRSKIKRSKIKRSKIKRSKEKIIKLKD